MQMECATCLMRIKAEEVVFLLEISVKSDVDLTLPKIENISVMIYHRGASLSKQHTDLLICHRTKQDLSCTSRYLGIT